MKYLKFLGIAILLMTLSCSKNNSDDEVTTFAVNELLTDVTNNDILPAVARFVEESDLLDRSLSTYLEETNEVNLIAAQEQWRVTALAYANIFVFNIGEVRDNFLNFALYNWPTSPNGIENAIMNNDEITDEMVANLSPQIKTLSAIEYLLFEGTNEAIIASYEESVNRQNYLDFVGNDLVTQSIRLQEIWLAPNNYATTFINNEGTGINSSFNLFYNGLFNLIDTGKVTKIGKPAGLENSENIDPETTQAFYSNTSLALLRENILSVRNVYFKTNGLGVADYVLSITDNTILNDAVAIKIDEVIGAIDAIPTDLFSAISSNPTEVAALHSRLGELGVLFSVDLRSVLSITITSTDNDGD